VTLPSTTAPGVYHVIASADDGTLVDELDESNNQLAPAALTISEAPLTGPDLTIATVSAPATISAGATVSLSAVVKNAGTMTAGSSVTRFVLSTDTIPGGNDVVLGSTSLSNIKAGASQTAIVTGTVPAGTEPGAYFIVGVADASGAVAESRESNNTGAAPVSIVQSASDLTFTAAAAPSSSRAGKTITMSYSLTNAGGAAAAASRIEFRLSADSSAVSGGVLLAAQQVGPLAAGAGISSKTSLTIPAGTVPGKYFLMVVADPDGTVIESNEDNNLIARPVTIQ
jgi:subtilase family serine protease